MMKFFDKPSRYILGCDPGPEHSAFALLEVDGVSGTPSVKAVSYAENDLISLHDWREFPTLLESFGSGEFSEAFRHDLTYAFERCSVQAGGANAMVFETCMAAGEIRYVMRRFLLCRICAFSPSDWRYILTGKGCANDANVRNLLLTLLPECDTICRSYSKKAKDMYGLRKPITSHLRDAIGVAMATGFVGYRKGLTLSQFPARLEVHCG